MEAMSNKEGFDGEYEFYDDSDEDDDINWDDEDEEELDEDDIEDEELEESVEKEKREREFLAKRQQELSDTVEGFIANRGYEQTYPNIHYSDVIDEAYITFLFEEENQFQAVSQDDLELWIKGKVKFEKPQEELLRKWYPSGTYRYFRILSELKKRHNVEKDDAKLKNLEQLIEVNEENFKRAKKVELAEAYKESGERLNKLYLAIYGRTDTTRLKMGFFGVGVPVMFYNDTMKESSYEDSKDFFEDFKNAYNFIFSLKGDYVIGTLTDESYEFIGGYAYGETVLESGNRTFEINSTIIREEWFNKKRCHSIVSDVYIENNDFLFWLNKYFPEVDAASTNHDTVIFWQGEELEGEYWPKAKDNFHLAIRGPIEKQEKMIKSLIGYITKEGIV